MQQEWSYRKLAEAYREEKGSNALTLLPSDFDLSLAALLQLLESQAKGGTGEALKELDNARRQAMGLLRLRRQKIVMRALLANEGEPDGMTEGEHALYDRVHGLADKEEERLAALMMPRNGSSGNGAGLAPSLKTIHLLKDVPAYRGADGSNYGPYQAGEDAQLPQMEAAWMVKGGMASESGA